ncbi:MAG: hypothetical protein CM1200mP16_16560 [Nitrospina sp.]|nr:MAG: hypothetical protein CM1200mP16_16560 [Nitrospina sp.]
MGHAITLTQPLKVRKVEEEGEFIGYSVNGTPADCVKLAITFYGKSPNWLYLGLIRGNPLVYGIIFWNRFCGTEAMVMGVRVLRFL